MDFCRTSPSAGIIIIIIIIIIISQWPET